MNGAILYRPGSRGGIWLGLAGALLIHAAAVALARYEPGAVEAVSVEPGAVDVSVEPVEAPPAPQEEVDVPDLPPLPDEAPDFLIDELPAKPPPAVPRERLIRPPTPAAQTTSLSQARVFALHAPRPEYPYEARRSRMTGFGVAELRVERASGRVLAATMVQSTGNPILDNATVGAFRRWRFRPGTVEKVRVPITFTLTGAAY